MRTMQEGVRMSERKRRTMCATLLFSLSLSLFLTHTHTHTYIHTSSNYPRIGASTHIHIYIQICTMSFKLSPHRRKYTRTHIYTDMHNVIQTIPA
jgi:hypothetical protein